MKLSKNNMKKILISQNKHQKKKQNDDNVMRYSVKDLEKRIENFKVKLSDLQTTHKKI